MRTAEGQAETLKDDWGVGKQRKGRADLQRDLSRGERQSRKTDTALEVPYRGTGRQRDQVGET